MRAILIDWLVEVAEEYKLMPETLYTTVTYMWALCTLHNQNVLSGEFDRPLPQQIYDAAKQVATAWMRMHALGEQV